MLRELFYSDHEIPNILVQPLFKNIPENMLRMGSGGKKIHVYSGTIGNVYSLAVALKVQHKLSIKQGDALGIDILEDNQVVISYNFDNEPLLKMTLEKFNELSHAFVATNEEELCKMVESSASQSRFYNLLFIAISFVYFLYQ